jgi:type VI secretion system protein ImpJ
VDYVQKVLWSEGMFLTPHHFQQSDRYHEGLLNRRLQAIQPLGAGLLRLKVDADALANGEFVLSQCAAVLPDGLIVDAPELDPLPPARPVGAAFDPKKTALGVYLASPLVRPGGLACAPEGAAEGSPARFQRKVATVADEHSGTGERPVTVAVKTLKVLFEGEPLSDYSSLKIAEVTRGAGGKFVLNEACVPPCLYLSASAALQAAVRRVLDLLSSKSEELSRARRQRSQGLVEFTMSEAANFWFLHTVNAAIPVLMHYHTHPDAHPEPAFLAMARVAGQLMTFAGEGHPKDLPLYSHDDPGGSFTGMEARIRQLLETVIPTRCTPIPLERPRESLFTGKLMDERLLEGAQFYLAVMADVPEEKIAREVPLKGKVSSMDRVDQLIAAALRGLVLRHLPTPPAEIPVQPGRTYFQIDRQGEHWEAVRKSRTIAFYLPPEFKQLRLEFMAVKE